MKTAIPLFVLLFLVVVAVMLITPARGRSPTTAARSKVFSTPIDSGTITLSIEHLASVAPLRGLFPEQDRDQIEHGTRMIAEASDAKSVVPLASAVVSVTSYVRPEDVHVLQVLQPAPGQVVLIMTVEHDLVLWRVQVQVPKSDWLDLVGWQVSSLSTRLDNKTVRVEARTLPDGRLGLAVSDLRPSNPQPPTLFEQDGAEWRFKVVKTWRDALNGK